LVNCFLMLIILKFIVVNRPKIDQSIAYTYIYFQKTWIQTKILARSKLIVVFVVNPSPKNILEHIAKVNIPAAKPNNLPGQIKPSNAINPNRVASMYR